MTLFSGRAPKSQGPAVLAKVGAREIAIEDFQQEVAWRRQNGRPVPDKAMLLEEMIARELRVQKARVAGLEHDPGVRRTYEDILAAKIEQRELMPLLEAAEVARVEIEAAYQTNLARYTQPAKYHLALIYIKTDRRTSSARLAEIESRMAEARHLAQAMPARSQGLGRVAADFSEDQASRYKGGDIGWFDQGRVGYRWPSEVIAAGCALRENGDLSEVLHTAEGFYLVMRLDYRPQRVTPLESVEPAIRRQLLADKQRQVQARFAQDLRALAPVQIDARVLAGLESSTTTMAEAKERVPPALPRSP
jgi:peptidyl-prolyl cis-trans isomerase C